MKEAKVIRMRGFQNVENGSVVTWLTDKGTIVKFYPFGDETFQNELFEGIVRYAR